MDKKEKICGIYKITSPSEKIYIGQSIDILKYRKSHYVRNECKDQPKLCNSIKKHGWENHTFEIIEECEFDELNCRERYWQDFYDVLGEKGLNCVLVSCEDKKPITSEDTKRKMSESRTGLKRNDETKEKIRQGKLGDKNPMFGLFGEDNPNFGNKRTPEQIEKWRNSMTFKTGEDHHSWGFKHSEESKKLMSDLRKGTNTGETNPFFGQQHTLETKEKMSKIKKDNLTEDVLSRLKELSKIATEKKKELWENNPEMAEVFKDKCSIAKSKYSYIQINPVTNDIINEFSSIREVVKAHPKANPSCMGKACKGLRKVYLGFKWKRRFKETGIIEEY
jgi:group I intron endonuclease